MSSVQQPVVGQGEGQGVAVSGLTIAPEIIDRIETIRVRPGRFGVDGDGAPQSWVCVERRDGFDGTRWAVVDMGLCLSAKTGEWDFEPMPSSRTEAWKRSHRWKTFQEAWAAAEACRLNPGLTNPV